MKARRVWRYKCDFCKKSNCKKDAMASHETRCFRNPVRACPVCEREWPLPALAAPMAALAEIDDATEKALIQDVEEAVDHCPACTCAAIMQAPLPMVEWDIPGEFHFGVFNEGSHGEYRYRVAWNYKTARDAYRADQEAIKSAAPEESPW